VTVVRPSNVQHILIIIERMCLTRTIDDSAGSSCDTGELSMKSKCYRKFHRQKTSWYVASNDCLTRGGSLAVFTDIDHPSLNTQLTDWLDTSSRNKTYWIGLIRSWWTTTDKGILDDVFSSSHKQPGGPSSVLLIQASSMRWQNFF